MKYSAAISVPDDVAQEMERICQEVDPSTRSKSPEFDEQYEFQNGMRMVIQVCPGGEDAPCWTQGVLYSPDGEEIGCTEPGDSFFRNYIVADGEDEYSLTIQTSQDMFQATPKGSNVVKITLESPKGAETLWEGDFNEATQEQIAAQTDEIRVIWGDDDALPLLLLDEKEDVIRELSGEECDLIMENSHVTYIRYDHPRASRCGTPVCAADIPEIWKGTCGNMGFKPHPDLELVTVDSGDDSVGEFTLTVKITPSGKCALDEMTKTAKKAIAAALEIDPEKVGTQLGMACRELSNQSDEELEATPDPAAAIVMTLRRCFLSPCPESQKAP